MLTEYIREAMKKAHYEIPPDGEGYFGRIEALPDKSDRGQNLLTRILQEAGISKAESEELQ